MTYLNIIETWQTGLYVGLRHLAPPTGKVDVMKNILVATDFSARSDRALQRAVQLAQQTGAALSLVHVVDDDQSERIVTSECEAARYLLDEQSAALNTTAGVTCKTQVILGAPFAGLGQVVGDDAPDLLVIGSHRRQALRDVFIGTTAERTIRAVACPVLMVNAVPAGPYRDVLMAVDLSASARAAVGCFAALGFAGQARVSAVYVFDAPALDLATGRAILKDHAEDYLKKERKNAARDLAKFMGEFDLKHIAQILRYNATTSAGEILSVAKEMSAGLIVVGTHGRRGLAAFFLGSVAEEILRRADIDVLAVPMPHEQ